jgi:hypothetical protein
MLANVGQCLLDDPVCGEVDRVGQRPRDSFRTSLDGQASSVERGEQLVESGQPEGRVDRGSGVIGLAEQPDGGTQVLEGGSPDLPPVR